MALAVIHDTTATDGAVVKLTVGPSTAFFQHLRLNGRVVPQSVTLNALIDTGSDVTCLDPFVLRDQIAAGLTHEGIGTANVPRFGGLLITTEYFVDLSLPAELESRRPTVSLGDFLVIEPPLITVGIQALLGRDVLARCLLVFDGPSARFTLAY